MMNLFNRSTQSDPQTDRGPKIRATERLWPGFATF